MLQPGFLESLRTRFVEAIPHCRETGITITELQQEYALAELPYRDAWLADPERGMLHPGIVTTLIDSACGIAVIAHLGRFDPIATLDLRVDYLRPAFRDKSLWCRAECFRRTATIAFMRARVWQDNVDEPVAHSQSVFMLGSQRARTGPL
jgi:uncharacterized protein (TIGR00369 family)